MTYRVIQHYETRETACVAEFPTWEEAAAWISDNQDNYPESFFGIDGDVEDYDLTLEDYSDPGDMDGDAASALASVGWGTDEDYGYAGEDY